jgi:hypothetical protein
MARLPSQLAVPGSVPPRGGRSHPGVPRVDPRSSPGSDLTPGDRPTPATARARSGPGCERRPRARQSTEDDRCRQAGGPGRHRRVDGDREACFVPEMIRGARTRVACRVGRHFGPRHGQPADRCRATAEPRQLWSARCHWRRRGDRPTVVLLHDLSRGSQMFRNLVAAPAVEYHLIARQRRPLRTGSHTLFC